MKYLKTKNISKFSIADRSFIVEQPSGKITTNSQNSIKIPTGSIERRPVVPDQGMIRFTTNDTINHEDENTATYFPTRPVGIEAYFDGEWRPVRLQGPAEITKTLLGTGNWDAIFQPNEDLSRFFPSSGEPLAIVPNSGDSVIVLVENVFQIHGAGNNFQLIESTGEVVAVEITNSGSGYATPGNVTVTFEDPFTGVAWTPNTELELSDYVFYTSGSDKNWYRVTEPGTTDPSTGPSHTSGASSNGTTLLTYVGTTARGTVTIAAGEITEVTVIDLGSGYTTIPSVSFNDSGAQGAGAAGTAVITKSGWHIEFFSAVPDTKKVYIYYGFDQ
jgi:hypothetical protein